MQLKNGEVTGRPTPVGILPAKDELNLEGVEITPTDLDTILSIDVERWRREMGHREQHLAQFDGLPDEIWQAHRRIATALGLGAD
jgi:phosphoenolpyruvate carboxykinase (GTP)